MFVEAAIERCYEEVTSDGFIYKLVENFPAFKGHFEGYPLLPAVCQISFCVNAAGRLLQQPLEVKALKRAKFMSPVLPGARIAVKLSKRPDGWYLAELTEVESRKKLSQVILQFSPRSL